MSPKPEILSPCGGPESVAAAVNGGADAVYLGASDFSARHNAVNFSSEELSQAVDFCHKNGVSVYLAMNTVIKEDELRAAAKLLETACRIGIDGIIFQDMAVYEMAKTACPDMPLHASTQMTIHTPEGVRAAAELGIKRVVAARELSLKEIKALCGHGAEIEVFVHGALCMCVSGQCFLSYAIGGRSANRGLCAGACRLPFSASGKPHDEYALSLKDLSLCEHLSELSEAGVSSFKIEGRMKRPEYVAAATDAVYSALNGESYDSERLRAVFSRSGFTDGYLTEKIGPEMFGARRKEDVTAAKDALPELRQLYVSPKKRFRLSMKLFAEPDRPLALEVSDGELSARAEGGIPEKAKNRPTAAAEVSEHLKKLGGTPYSPEEVDVFIADGLYISISKINSLRRAAVAELDRLRAEKLRRDCGFDSSGLIFDFPTPLILKHPRLRLRVENIVQLSAAYSDGDEAVIPIGAAEEYLEKGFSPEKCILRLPRFDTDEKKTAGRLQFVKTLGFEMVECGNIGQIRLVKSLGMSPQGGFGLNITNSLAARHYCAEGVKTLTLSPELKAAGFISCPGEVGAIVYGRLPLMIMRNCPIAAQVGCKNCKKSLTDRTGTVFPVLCHRAEGTYELLNSRPIWLADRLGGLNLDFADLWFTTETPDEVAEIVKAYKEGRKAGGVFTRG